MLIAGRSSARAIMPFSTRVRQPPPTSRGFSSTAPKGCARFRSCRSHERGRTLLINQKGERRSPCRSITFEPRSDYMAETRKETDSLGVVEVPADKLWGAQTQRSLEHFSIGQDLIPREMITAYATLKKAAANANDAGGRLDELAHRLIVQVCDEILAGPHNSHFC